MKGFRFSIVLPVYNAEKFILKTLETVESQTCRDFELVVTNDGSVDKSAEVLERWAVDHPEISVNMEHRKNAGIGAARNSGLKRAAGELVAFLDHDDAWKPEKLERVNRFMQSHQDVDVVCHDELERDLDGRTTPIIGQAVAPPAYENLLLTGNQLSTSATVLKTDLARKVGGFSEDRSLESVEDYDFWLKLGHARARFGRISEILGYYNRVQGSPSSRIAYHTGNLVRLLDRHFDAFQKDNPERFSEVEHIRRARKFSAYDGGARMLAKGGGRLRSAHFFLRAAANAPGRRALARSLVNAMLAVSWLTPR